MSDFFRRASDAFHHRRSSTDSTDAPTSPDVPSAAKPPEQEPLNQKPESTQPKSYGNEAFAGTANDNITPPKQHHLWGWPHHQEKQPGTKQQPSQKQEDVDWVVGT
ncbi:hypothetical protein PDIG_04360 [Penicillium digitatum PHI26]|uniref:Uncharacterized protein n=2 Tax=Penicillium digitatum TaxID=36651 RepID=K9H1W4_PEND2|nr:hypothetical protein PDIP_09020 [Penicillium digitatum Pd1]EKV19146.1 hypothetical protein PDIG_04360 [Penicillium digitatum PHI26]EKV21235.1 hypothetical protein PDIP_09020 [Penicillium digitatum Pd1]